MRFGRFPVWFLRMVPRVPRRAGLLMKLYYFWDEAFTPSGHALAAAAFTAFFLFMMPGFAVKIFLGIFLACLLTSLALSRRRPSLRVISAHVSPVREGETARLIAMVQAEKAEASVSLGSFRMAPVLRPQETESGKEFQAAQGVALALSLEAPRRGAFLLPRVAALVPDPLGFMRSTVAYGKPVELLVFPRMLTVAGFPFLTEGARGREFALFFMPALSRGMDFIGVRPYREGDALRDLHHMAFARYGKPFTREFAVERGAGVVLVLDVACRRISERMYVEGAIRLAGGIARWLFERGVLGRFFIGDTEVDFSRGSSFITIEEALARIPPAGLGPYPKPHRWSPASRPAGPVLGVSVLEQDSPFFRKQVVVCGKESRSEDVLCVDIPETGEVRL